MPSLFESYIARRRAYPKQSACEALRLARSDNARGRVYSRASSPLLGHGDVIRIRNAAGERMTLVVAIVDDDDATPPWEREEGHGDVSEWVSRDKAPGERELNADRGSKRFYDWQGAMKRAKAQDWGLGPAEMAELAEELGRKPTAGQIRERAVQRDFDRLRQWCNDHWRYVGVCLFRLDTSEECNASSIADEAPFGDLDHVGLWGIESDNEEFYDSVIREHMREAFHRL